MLTNNGWALGFLGARACQSVKTTRFGKRMAVWRNRFFLAPLPWTGIGFIVLKSAFVALEGNSRNVEV